MRKWSTKTKETPVPGGTGGELHHLHWVHTPMPAEYSLVDAP